MLQIVQELKGDPDSFLDDPTRFDYFYAIYLLAQFRVKELYPLLVDILSLPGDSLEMLFGDALTEDLGRILATVYNGEPEPLMRLIENPEADGYVRGQALYALASLVFHEQLDRAFVVDYMKQLLTGKLRDVNPDMNAHIIHCCTHLYPEEVMEEIEALYARGEVETFFIDRESVRSTLQSAKEDVLHRYRQERNYQYMQDVVTELQGWAAFQRDEKREAFRPATAKAALRSMQPSEPKQNPAVKTEKIGRNEPCPCGSGLKYKKCCGK